MTEHTKGPWAVHDYRHVFAGDAMVAVAVSTTSSTFGISVPTAEANARLIAAAPEMLIVLNAVRIAMKNRDRHEHEEPIYDAVRWVVAKAEGR